MITDNWLFVGAAFAVTWGMLIGYFVHVRRAMKRARQLAEGLSAGGTP